MLCLLTAPESELNLDYPLQYSFNSINMLSIPSEPHQELEIFHLVYLALLPIKGTHSGLHNALKEY